MSQCNVAACVCACTAAVPRHSRGCAASLVVVVCLQVLINAVTLGVSLAVALVMPGGAEKVYAIVGATGMVLPAELVSCSQPPPSLLRLQSTHRPSVSLQRSCLGSLSHLLPHLQRAHLSCCSRQLMALAASLACCCCRCVHHVLCAASHRALQAAEAQAGANTAVAATEGATVSGGLAWVA